MNEGGEEGGTSTAEPVIEALLRKRWRINARQEHDLYELFNVFVTTWDEEIHRIAGALDRHHAGLNCLVEVAGLGPTSAPDGAVKVTSISTRERETVIESCSHQSGA